MIGDEAGFVTDELFDSTSGHLSLLSIASDERGFFCDNYANQTPIWQFFKVTDDDYPRITKECLDRERVIRGEQNFRREYFREFQAGRLQFTSREVIGACFDMSLKREKIPSTVESSPALQNRDRQGSALASSTDYDGGALLHSVMKLAFAFLSLTAYAQSSLWTEELTSQEVRDAIKSGKSTIVIGTGGVEQNGPYTAGGKHNFVLQTAMPYIAKAIGNTLLAPIVKFVPEGDIDPKPSGHMLHAGTISVEQATFEALLTDICRSYKTHGFTDIILIGESGGNQTGMANVAKKLNAKWAAEKARVHFLAEYYSEDMWSYEFLKKRGIVQIDKTPPPGKQPDHAWHTRNGIHDDVHYEAMIAVHDPTLIRAQQRIKSGDFSLHGVNLKPLDKTIQLGRDLAEYRAQITAKAFARSKAAMK